MLCNRFNTESNITKQRYYRKIQAGERDKKTNGPYLIQLAYDTKTLPIIGTFPVLKPVELPTMLTKPPTVILFETCNKTIIQEGIDIA